MTRDVVILDGAIEDLEVGRDFYDSVDLRVGVYLVEC